MREMSSLVSVRFAKSEKRRSLNKKSQAVRKGWHKIMGEGETFRKADESQCQDSSSRLDQGRLGIEPFLRCANVKSSASLGFEKLFWVSQADDENPTRA
jgi:hypothetical protein